MKRGGRLAHLFLFPFHHDATEDAPAKGTLAPGGEKVFVLRIGTDRAYLYPLPIHPQLFELQLVASLQVDMPFVIAAGNAFHIEACQTELFVDLVTHLKLFYRDARTDESLQLLGIRAEVEYHRIYRKAHDVGQCAAPSGMNGSYNMIHVIMEQHRYTVGRGDTNADSRLTGDECIHPVEERLAHTCIEIQHFRCHHPYLCMMDLMRHDEMLVINPQMVAKKNLVGFHILHPVTTIAIDVH